MIVSETQLQNGQYDLVGPSDLGEFAWFLGSVSVDPTVSSVDSTALAFVTSCVFSMQSTLFFFEGVRLPVPTQS